MENQRNDQPEWLNSDESDFSGYSEDDIDSDRAYSSGNDDSGQSGSENEQENEPERGGWKMTGQQGPRLSFMDQYQVLMLSWVQMRTCWIFFYCYSQPFCLNLWSIKPTCMQGRGSKHVLILGGLQLQEKRWKPGSACGLQWAFYNCLRQLCTGLLTLCLEIYLSRKWWQETDLTRSASIFIWMPAHRIFQGTTQDGTRFTMSGRYMTLCWIDASLPTMHIRMSASMRPWSSSEED